MISRKVGEKQDDDLPQVLEISCFALLDISNEEAQANNLSHLPQQSNQPGFLPGGLL